MKTAVATDHEQGWDFEKAAMPYVDSLYNTAYRMTRNSEDAEDLVQETYMKVLSKPRFLRNNDDLGYLLRVLRNTFYSSHRSAQRRPQTAVMPEDYEPVDTRSGLRPDEAFEAREVFAVIAGLAPDFRDALVAVDVAGLSYREAAKLLGAKEATITSRLHRARRQVVAALGQESPTEGVS